MDETGEEKELVVEDFAATVVQHELDHLHGTLYVDRVEKTNLMFEEEYAKYHQSEDSSEEVD
ncbi:MAG: peptide deformylase [Bdellovibrionota bacterium]